SDPDMPNDGHFAPSNVETFVRWRDRGSSALTADPFRVLPKNMNPNPDPKVGNPSILQLLNATTPYNMSLDTAHLAPLLFRSSGSDEYVFNTQANPPDTYPKLRRKSFPNVSFFQTILPSNPSAAGHNADDFSPDFRSRTAAELRRLNLNRGITSNAN